MFYPFFSSREALGTATNGRTLFEYLCAIVCIFFKISVSEFMNTCSFIIYAFFILVCPLGYIGLNCSFRCRYPAFGQFCQNKCYCLQFHCDHRTGCKGIYFFIGNYVHVFKLIYFFDSIVNVICTTTGTMPNHKKNTVKTPIQQKRTKNVIFKTVFGSSFLIQSVQLKKNEYLESFGAQ